MTNKFLVINRKDHKFIFVKRRESFDNYDELDDLMYLLQFHSIDICCFCIICKAVKFISNLQKLLQWRLPRWPILTIAPCVQEIWYLNPGPVKPYSILKKGHHRFNIGKMS